MAIPGPDDYALGEIENIASCIMLKLRQFFDHTTAPWRPLTNISQRSEGFRYLKTGCLSGKPLDGRSVVEMP